MVLYTLVNANEEEQAIGKSISMVIIISSRHMVLRMLNTMKVHEHGAMPRFGYICQHQGSLKMIPKT